MATSEPGDLKGLVDVEHGVISREIFVIIDVTEATASENNQRGFYTRWRQLMEAESWAGL